MDRVNISIPEELHRQAKIAAVDRYLGELDAELGPISPEDQARAEEFIDRIYGP